MSALDIVNTNLMAWPQPQVLDDSDTVVVPTHFLYPSGTVVRAYVECLGSRVRVSDGGGALREISGLGSFQFDIVKMMRIRAKSWDITVSSEGWMLSDLMPTERMAELIAWVATASHNLASVLTARMSSRQKAANFRLELDSYLERRFEINLNKKKTFVGASHKEHKFDYFLSLGGGDEGILIDAVLNDVSSINSKVVAHLDVAKTERPNLLQRIVYDDRDEDWKSSDLSLLRVGAVPLAFTELNTSLARALHKF